MLASPFRVVILSHINPDGDAIGSMLGMYWFLKNRGCTVNMAVPNEIPQFLNWMEGAEQILDFRGQRQQVVEELNNADLVFCLDFNEPDRLGGIKEIFEKTDVLKILVDHHPNPTDFTKYGISVPSASSTAELCYNLMVELDGKASITKTVAECLFVGMMTDTGCFSFNSSDPKTFHVVSSLLEAGIDKDNIYSLVYDNYTEDRMRMLGYSLKEKMVVLPEHSTAYIYLSRNEMEKYNYQAADTEGFVNYPFSIRGIRVTALFLEKKNHIKISFRSKGEFAINRFAGKYFNGGGHNNAAGGESAESLNDTIKKFESLIAEYSDEIKDLS
ncbi:bifunctional oligoribonuclease/PAP phosphatase NrnA [Bacteroidota bacterium]